MCACILAACFCLLLLVVGAAFSRENLDSDVRRRSSSRSLTTGKNIIVTLQQAAAAAREGTRVKHGARLHARQLNVNIHANETLL